MIKIEKNLVDLADKLVPSNIKSQSPSFYGVVQSFLRNVQDVQDSININALDVINYDKINNNEIKQIYLDTYIGMLDLKDEPNIESLGDLVQVSKDISLKKGTQFLYNILFNLLYYIVPSLGNTYNTLLTEYNTTDSDERKLELEIILAKIKADGLESGFFTYTEFYTSDEIVPFKYKIVADIEEETFDKFIKKFAHPAGWDLEFIQAVSQLVLDTVESKVGFTLYDSFVYPLIDGSGNHDGDNSNLEYPNNYYDDALLGDEIDYDEIVAKLSSTDNIEVRDGSVYYIWNNLNDAETIIGTFTDQDPSYIITPSITGIKPTGGSYTTTEDIAYGNGVITGGTWNLTYQILVNK